MAITLDVHTEQRILDQIGLNHHETADDVINHALDALADEVPWTDEERLELDRTLEEGMAAIERGEGIPGDQVRELLATRRAARLR